MSRAVLTRCILGVCHRGDSVSVPFDQRIPSEDEVVIDDERAADNREKLVDLCSDLQMQQERSLTERFRRQTAADTEMTSGDLHRKVSGINCLSIIGVYLMWNLFELMPFLPSE